MDQYKIATTTIEKMHSSLLDEKLAQNKNHHKVFCLPVSTLLWSIKCSKIWLISWFILSFLELLMEYLHRNWSKSPWKLFEHHIKGTYTDPDKALLYPNEWRPREVFYGFVYVPLFSIYGEIFNGERNSYGHAESLEPGEDCVITTNKVRFRSISGLISGLKFGNYLDHFWWNSWNGWWAAVSKQANICWNIAINLYVDCKCFAPEFINCTFLIYLWKASYSHFRFRFNFEFRLGTLAT